MIETETRLEARFTTERCPGGCGFNVLVSEFSGPLFCPQCERRLPPALRKACSDYFDYALKLRDGTVVCFSQAYIQGEFATLTDCSTNPSSYALENPMVPFPRGLDVRIADIVWCADLGH